MAQPTLSRKVSLTPPRTRGRLGRNGRFALLMGGPAFFGLIVFLVVPFFLAFLLSFTNQRLLSPNPTEWVGLRNYSRLVGMTVLPLEPERDETTGNILRDDAGSVEYPRSRSITRSDPRYEGFSEWLSFDRGERRYVVLAKDPTFLRSLVNIFLFAVVVIPLQSSVGLALALLLNQGLPGTKIFRTLYFSPVVTSMVVVSIVWSFMYEERRGLMNQFLQSISFGTLGPIDWLGDPRFAMLSIILMSIWQGAGLQMVIFLAGLQAIPNELYEAANIDGANRWQKFRFVTLPSLYNTTVFIIITITIAAFSLFTQVDVMTSGGPDNATATVMFHAVRAGFREQDIAYGAAITVIYFLLILSIALVQRRLLVGGRAQT